MIKMLLNRALWLGGTALGSVGLGGINLWMLAGAAALAVVPAGATYVSLKISHAHALGKVRGDERAVCERRVAEIERRINEAVADRERAAREAEDTVASLETPKEIEEACARESSCRDRGNGK